MERLKYTANIFNKGYSFYKNEELVIRRAICVLLFFSILYSCSLPQAFAVDDGVHSKTDFRVDDFYQYVYDAYLVSAIGPEQYWWLQYLANDSMWGFVHIAEDLSTNQAFQFALDVEERLTEFSFSDIKHAFGEDPRQESIVEYYVIALSSLMMTLESNLDDVHNEQAKADATMGWKDYLAEGTQLAYSAGALLTGYPVIKEAFSIGNISVDIISDSLTSFEQAEFLAKNAEKYLAYHNLLQLIIDSTNDGNLKKASAYLKTATDKCFEYYTLHLVSDYSDIANNAVSNYFFDVFEKVLEEAKNDGSLHSEEINALGGLCDAANAVNSFKFGVDIGRFAGDIFLKSSDTILRYYEITVMAEVRKALISKIYKINAHIRGPEDFEAIKGACELLEELLYVTLRGEYCVYMLKTQDVGLLSLVTMIGQSEYTEKWFDGLVSTISWLQTIIDGIFPDWEEFSVNNKETNWDEAQHNEDTDKGVSSKEVTKENYEDIEKARTTEEISVASTGFADAYLEILSNNEIGIRNDVIEKSVAVFDITGDGIPELLYLSKQGEPSFSLDIVSWTENKGAYRIFHEQTFSYWMQSQYLFQIEGQKELFSYLDGGDLTFQTILTEYTFNEASSSLEIRHLLEKREGFYDYVNSKGLDDLTFYGASVDGVDISEAEYNSRVDEVLEKECRVILTGGFSVQSASEYVAMTFDEAVSYLEELNRDKEAFEEDASLRQPKEGNTDVTTETISEEGLIASGTCGANGDNLTWKYYDNWTLVIEGTGDMADYLIQEGYPSETSPWLVPGTIPYQQLETVVIADGVTSIGNNAFATYYCQKLSTVIIPDTVTRIGERSFAFLTGLKSVTLPSSIESIGEYAFGETGLTDVYYAGSEAEWNAVQKFSQEVISSYGSFSIGIFSAYQPPTIHFQSISVVDNTEPLAEQELLVILESRAGHSMDEYIFVDMDHDGAKELIGTYTDRTIHLWYCSSEGTVCKQIYEREWMDYCAFEALEAGSETHVGVNFGMMFGNERGFVIVCLEEQQPVIIPKETLIKGHQ